MKHIIILGDGMADHAVERLGGLTPLQYARKPYMNRLAREGRTGRLITVPEGYVPGSEVANTAILGYDLDSVYEGRGPLEAASIGYRMRDDDMAMRCNLITLSEGKIKNHHGGHLTTDEADVLIRYLDEHLGNDDIRFVTGIQYRHLLVIRGADKHIACSPPHDHPDEPWQPLLVKPETGCEKSVASDGKSFSQASPSSDVPPRNKGRMSPQETARLVNSLILRSHELLENHPLNIERVSAGKLPANSIWPWGGGYKPRMQTISRLYPQVKSGACISAVDLIRGICTYAGLDIIKVEGATGLADTNYEGKAQAAIEALRNDDFVFLHVEASDEAGHDGDLELKIKTIENLDSRIVRPIYEAVLGMNEPVCIALLPDHPTPVEIRTHVNEPVPFAIWHKGIEPDGVVTYDETACVAGSYGLLRLGQFMQTLMAIE